MFNVVDFETGFTAVRPWRVGRSVGRTVYAQIGDEPSKQDVLIGLMDTPELARLVCAAVNAYDCEETDP
jgi:hypothetical protein